MPFWAEAFLSKEDLARIRRVGQRQPKAVKATIGGVLRHVTNSLKKAVRTGCGSAGIPVFSPRNQVTILADGPRWGGIMKKAEYIGMWRYGGYQFIGFKSSVPAYIGFGRTVQTEQTGRIPGRVAWRLAWRAGLPKDTVRDYYRPARPVIAPYADWMTREVRTMFMDRLRLEIQRDLARRQ